MPSTINGFISSFKNDIARPSRFDVEITIPYGLMNFGLRDLTDRLSLRCETAEMPGRTFATTERNIYGPVELYPYHTTYENITLTFIVSGDMEEKRLFDSWMDLVNPPSTYNFSYRDDYCTDIIINQYSVTNEKTYSVRLIDAFPVSVNQLDMDWTNENSPHKLSVILAYHKWEAIPLPGFTEPGFINAAPLIKGATGTVYGMDAIATSFNRLKPPSSPPAAPPNQTNSGQPKTR